MLLAPGEWGLIFSALVTGVFGIVLVLMQRQTHREVKSPNGTRTGEKVYAVEQKAQDIENRLIRHIADDAVALAKFTSLIDALRTDEAAAHAADFTDRRERAETVKEALGTSAAEVKQALDEAAALPPKVVVVSPLPSQVQDGYEVGQTDLSSGGKTE